MNSLRVKVLMKSCKFCQPYASPNNRIITLISPGKYYGKRRTHFTVFWPPKGIMSKWHFITDSGHKVYLKYKQNSFGRSELNNIIIHDPHVVTRAFVIRVPDYGRPEIQKTLRCGQMRINGRRMTKTMATFRNKMKVELVLGRKVLVFLFRKD